MCQPIIRRAGVETRFEVEDDTLETAGMNAAGRVAQLLSELLETRRGVHGAWVFTIHDICTVLSRATFSLAVLHVRQRGYDDLRPGS